MALADAARVDLHMHTTASDGEDTPEELAARCAAAGLSTVALTDHNSTANVTRMRSACATHGIEVVPACEISTSWNGKEHHCLAYFVPLDDPVFNARIERVRAEDLARSRRWVDNAATAGVAITWDQVEARLGADRVPPFSLLSRLLLEAGGEATPLAASRAKGGSLYGEWFAPGRPWATEPPWQPSPPEAIAWVREAGGVVVLAHPGATLGSLDPEAALRELAGAGLGGVEAWTTWHSEATALSYAELGARLELAVTAGADYHGPVVKPHVKSPGQVTHNGPDVLERLEAARAQG
jgi:predicted metal-dependent phosphoesterase TrpH